MLSHLVFEREHVQIASSLGAGGPARFATMQCGCSPTNIDCLGCWGARGYCTGTRTLLRHPGVFTSCLQLGCEPPELTCVPVADDQFIYAVDFARLCWVDVACAPGPRCKALRYGTWYTATGMPVGGWGTTAPYLDSGRYAMAYGTDAERQCLVLPHLQTGLIPGGQANRARRRGA